MNRDNADGMPGADFIACLEQSLGDPPSVQERPVAAIQVLDTASLVGTFEGEMQAGD